MSRPLLSDPPEKLHSQTDSFLTAARLVRRGWTEEVKKTGWQFSHFECSANQPSPSRSDGNLGPKRAEISTKGRWSRRVPVENSRETAENRETTAEKKADEAKQTSEGAFSANAQAERQMDLCSQTGIVRVCASGCRTTCRQYRRFKAPILPVIAEI